MSDIPVFEPLMLHRYVISFIDVKTQDKLYPSYLVNKFNEFGLHDTVQFVTLLNSTEHIASSAFYDNYLTQDPIDIHVDFVSSSGDLIKAFIFKNAKVDSIKMVDNFSYDREDVVKTLIRFRSFNIKPIQ